MTDADVLVVGAGPVGLLLAGELRLGGASVVVAERLTEPMRESRAGQLNARSMELFDQRGLLDRLPAPERIGTGHFGGIPLSVADVDSHLPGFWQTPQYETEAMLGGWAQELGADVRRSHDLHTLTPNGDGMRAEFATLRGTEALRASYVVGCDGGTSTVRRLAGIPFTGRDASRALLRADVTGVRIPDRRFERHEHGLAIAARRPNGVTRVMVHEFGAAPRRPTFTEVATAWSRVTGEDIAGATPVWVDSFDDTSRQAARYRDGRVLLAGDAAHVQLPAGGQALNLGLADAVNLGWRLAAEVHGSAADGLLDGYHRERHPVGARVQAAVDAQAMLLLGGAEADGVRAVFTELLARPDTAAHLAAFASGLDVSYPGDGHPLAGTRLPRIDLVADGAATDTYHLLRQARWVLLDLSDRHVTTPGVWRVAAKAAPGGALDGVGAVLLRPDGHIAWVDSPDLATALPQWFREGGERR